ncbi:MAG: hypothetical protein ABI321_04280 [Polyangia bacterium]
MRAHLESIVEGQRRKQLLATVIAAIAEALLFGALVFAVFRLGMPNLVLSKPRRLALVALVLIAFALAFLVEQRRQARSTLYWAKLIDDTNQLGDHLVSALAFADPAETGFEQACVNSLVGRLSHMQLRLPDVRIERLWLIAPAILLACATAGIDYQRRKRPQDDGHQVVVLSTDFTQRWEKSLDDASGSATKADARLVDAAREAKKLLGDLGGQSVSKESIVARTSAETAALDEFERDNPSIIQAALQIGNPSTQRARAFVNGVQSGQTAAVNDALENIEKALSGQSPPALSPEERDELKGAMKELARATGNHALAEALDQVGDTITDQTQDAATAKAVGALRPVMSNQVAAEVDAKKLIQQVRQMIAATNRSVNLQTKQFVASTTPRQPGSEGSADAGPAGVAQKGEPGGEVTPGSGVDDAPGEKPSGGPSAGSATDPNFRNGSPEAPANSGDERVSSPWVGAPVRQLVAAASASDKGAQNAYREQLAATRRVAENEVQREQIPAEYAGAIRTYFFNLQQDWDQKWKPSK